MIMKKSYCDYSIRNNDNNNWWITILMNNVENIINNTNRN